MMSGGPRLQIRAPEPASRFQFLTVPGLGGSGPQHWQTLWQRDDPSMLRIEQRDWDHPEAGEWSFAIETGVRNAAKAAILVAHSCGVTAIAHWVHRYETPIAGAFLVAPPDWQRPGVEPAVRDFGPMPLDPLPFPAMVVASEDDPYCDLERARGFATSWGASFVSAGKAGHINTASGHGPWPEGKRLLTAFATELFLRRRL